MEIVSFVESRRPRWLELEKLLDKSEAAGMQALSVAEAKQLIRLYRAASGDLLWARSRSAAVEVSGYLNDLVGRAYALTYPGKQAQLVQVGRFLARGFPEVMRRETRMFLAALLLFGAGAGFGYVGMLMDPQAVPYLVPEQHQKLDPLKRAKEAEKADVASVDTQAAFSSFLFTHNIQVAFLCFALGLTAGVGTAIMLFSNGLMLGALAQVYGAKGMGGWFWAWILPHGIPEITAICIAGAGGFVLARGLLAPRGLSRRDALRSESRGAVQLILGTLALFVLAGLIEGTLSQIHPPHLSVAFKIGFALVVGTGVYAYLFSAYRRVKTP